MIGWLASGGPVYIPSGTPAPSPTQGVYVSAPGVNVGQLLGILLPLVVCAIAVLTYRDVKMAQRQKASSKAIQNAVESLTTILTERLESKENVALVRIDVARVRTEVATLREVIREQDRKLDRLMADIQRQQQQQQRRSGGS